MPDYQLVLEAPAHNNHGLFADHTLNRVLPRRPEWQQLAGAAAPVMAQVAQAYRAFRPDLNEAEAEHHLVRPVLEILGHHFQIQPGLRVPGTTQRPDYILVRSPRVEAAHRRSVLTREDLGADAIAVADAKAVSRPLDAALAGGDPFTNRTPSWQIWMYLVHSGVDWGILTNGRLWRLYHKETAASLDRYYEVDLEALAREGDPERFLYFWLFFRREAFDDAPLGLGQILRASADYARAVGDSLKDQVYDALRHVAQGFLDYAPNRLQADPETLQAVYDSSLILLYRLLFILYAEARELLPVRESAMYRESYSLQSIKRDVAGDLGRGRQLMAGGAGVLWPRLQELWRAINTGSPPLKVATYNGGLFDPEHHPFLVQHAVGDGHLQQAIDKLARVNGEFVDYRDLSVRHMGTIYEGLLEYRLQAIEPEEGWSVDLVNDKGERKATGSYYTPDTIVKYIVDQAVGPALEEAVAGKPDDASKVNAILQVNVLDPAMGSGHFLVEATEYIARFLVELGIAPEGHAGGEPDLAFWKRRVAHSCIYGVDLNPLAVELAKLSLWLTTVAKDRPLSFLDHHLRPGNSLVGAGLAALQRRLPGNGRPRGRRQAERAEANGQISMHSIPGFTQSMYVAVRTMGAIERSEALTVEDVKQQERWYAELRSDLIEKYARLANLITAAQFGLEVDPSAWETLVRYVTASNGAQYPAFETLLAQADAIAARERFFHWELEFPEVYFDEIGRSLGEEGGFEAVVGNPPYVRQEQLARHKPYFAGHFEDVHQGTADLFVYFFAQGLRQVRRGGRLSYVASNSWLRANYAGPLRKLLRTQATVEKVVDLGDNRVFAEAPDVYPAIEVVRKGLPPAEHVAQAAVFSRGEGLARFEAQVASKLFPVSIHDQPDSGWQLSEDAGRRIFEKLMAAGRPLSEVVAGRMYRGVLTGRNEAFIVDDRTRAELIAADPASASVIVPLVNGEDVRPWYVEEEGRWLIFARRGIDIDAYPAVKQHLSRFRGKLEPRPADRLGNGTWEGRKPGPYQWYEIQDVTGYHEEFRKAKILWPEMAKQPRFALADPGVVCNKTAFIIPGGDAYLLGLLASRVSWFVVSRLCVPIGERRGMLRYTLSAQFMSRLPVPDPPPAERGAIGALAMAITEKARERYALHNGTRRRILADWGTSGRKLNLKLTAWWDLDFTPFRMEVKKALKSHIPVAQRDEWEHWLDARRAEHHALTGAIVSLESELNERVYALFHLTRDEIRVIERATKYRYGEV